MESKAFSHINPVTIYIGDLDPWMDYNYLNAIFKNSGITHINIGKNALTGTNPGYAFLEFISHDHAKAVVDNLYGKPMPDSNKNFVLKWIQIRPTATMSSAPNPNLISPRYSQSEKDLMPNDYPIYVGGLSEQVTEQILLNTFNSKYSSAYKTKIIIDAHTKKSKGYGFVTFRDLDDAQKALKEMNGYVLCSKPIKINKASVKRIPSDDPPSGGNNNRMQYSNSGLNINTEIKQAYYTFSLTPTNKIPYEELVSPSNYQNFQPISPAHISPLQTINISPPHMSPMQSPSNEQMGAYPHHFTPTHQQAISPSAIQYAPHPKKFVFPTQGYSQKQPGIHSRNSLISQSQSTPHLKNYIDVSSSSTNPPGYYQNIMINQKIGSMGTGKKNPFHMPTTSNPTNYYPYGIYNTTPKNSVSSPRGALNVDAKPFQPGLISPRYQTQSHSGNIGPSADPTLK